MAGALVRTIRGLVLPFGLLAAGGAGAAEPLRVVATLPDLASLAREVGGEEVEVTALARGGDDPHFVEAKPSFLRTLSRADLFAYNGLDLEIGWLPPLVRNARNGRILPGASGDFDASRGIPALELPGQGLDRSRGDVHPYGNPHYLLDPVNGLRVARHLRDRLQQLAPERAAGFGARAADFEGRLVAALVGREAADRFGPAAVAQAALEERLPELLAGAAPGGWLGALAPHRGAPVVADHNLWPYFARRFGLRVVGFLEPVPGITPTTRHLRELAEQMGREKVRVILSAAYFHPRYAEKLALASGAAVLAMANQVGAREGVDDYLTMLDRNVRELVGAL